VWSVCASLHNPTHRGDMDSLKETKPRIVVTDDHPATIKLSTDSWRAGSRLWARPRTGSKPSAQSQFQPDILITEIEMPMMDSIRAAGHLQRMNSGLKIVFMSARQIPTS